MNWARGYDRLPKRERADVAGVVVHRIEVSQEDSSFGDTPAEINRFFREHPVGKKATGGAAPYPILIEASGEVTQVLPLARVAPHAVSHNPTTIGVACVGDFRTRPPTPFQYDALVEVCSQLLRDFSLPVEGIRGHDELSGGSRDPDKECPGRTLSISELRKRVDSFEGTYRPGRFEW